MKKILQYTVSYAVCISSNDTGQKFRDLPTENKNVCQSTG